MSLRKIQKIIIFGGGTSGWLTATYLAANLKIKTEITLIESSEHQPIGVGEGTQPYTSAFLNTCGVDPLSWMKPSQASFKYGVELVGWNESPYFVDNDHFINHVAEKDFYAHDFFIDKDPKEYFDWLPAYRLAKKNISPKIGTHDFNPGPGLMTFGAVHFSAADIIETLKKIAIKKVKHINTKIIKINQDQDGIQSLTDDTGEIYKADLFIDCTGFSCELMEKALGVKFYNYENTLPCNSAVAIPTSYKDPITECHPYTKATTMNAGWRWTIPTFARIGNGYVYSDKFISSDDAEKELRTVLDDWSTPARHLKMKCGRLESTAFKNVCAVGLSAGFVEPLEATGITFTTKIVEWLTNVLNNSNNIWNDNCKEVLNRHFNFMCVEIHAFIWAHYNFSTRSDTDFWKQFRNKDITDIPQSIKDILKSVLPFPNGNFYLTPDSMFHQGHWFSVLHSGGKYRGVNQNMKFEDRKYLEYFIESIRSRIDLAEKYFPNHFTQLEQWYK